MKIIHRVREGLAEDLTQRCVRCGAIVVDYRNSAVMLRPGETAPTLSGFPAGDVTVSGADGYVTASSAGAEPDARLCATTYH